MQSRTFAQLRQARLLQESGAKRQRNEGEAPIDGVATAQGTGEAAAANGEAAAPAFASAGAQDVSTINDTGDAMQPVEDAPSAEVRPSCCFSF